MVFNIKKIKVVASWLATQLLLILINWLIFSRELGLLSSEIILYSFRRHHTHHNVAPWGYLHLWSSQSHTRDCSERTEWNKQAEEEGSGWCEEVDQVSVSHQTNPSRLQFSAEVPENAKVRHQGILWNSWEISDDAGTISILVSEPGLQGEKSISYYLILRHVPPCGVFYCS